MESQNQIKLFQHAYEVLGDPTKKTEYDQRISSQTDNPSITKTPMSPSPYKSDFANLNEDIRRSPTMKAAIVTMIMLGLLMFFINHDREKNKTEIAYGNEATKRQAISAEAENISKHLDNEAILVKGTIENQGKYIDDSARIAEREQQRRQAELIYRVNANNRILDMQQQQLNDQNQRVREEKQQYENERAAAQARQNTEWQRQQLFNKLIIEHRYREAADFAKTPNDIARLTQLEQSENRTSVDQSSTLECQQARRSYETAAFRGQDRRDINVKQELMRVACGRNGQEINIYRR